MNGASSLAQAPAADQSFQHDCFEQHGLNLIKNTSWVEVILA
jgi:hypothetical protein